MSEQKKAEKQKLGGEAPPRGRARPSGVGGVSGKQCVPPRLYRPPPYPYEIRRRAVQLYLEEGLSAVLVAKELGVSDNTVGEWARRYQRLGDAGLRPQVSGPEPSKLPVAVRAKIAQLKKEQPQHGAKRISQILRRIFCLQASPETVRQQLKRTGDVLQAPKARKKPKPPQRRFESATPNQMWQSDITYFPILGKTAYIVGFIDDHSRYITGLGVYRSQTSENVVETYRLATGEFGTPKEMLTDNGRQYACWRGTTRFQQELKKDHVHHIRSAPHHPMTLGKIERFWQSLKDEFLMRARFETFEEARERIVYWVKYYNHQRPHQGLDGMTPADRFFSIQKEMRAVIERGVAANVEEMALRGRPVEPFYMVGRIGDKSVVIETDRKTVSVRVDGRPMEAGNAMVYDMKERGQHEAGNNDSAAESAGDADIQRKGKESGGAGAVERAAHPFSSEQRAGSAVDGGQHLGEAGALRDAHGPGSEMEAAGCGTAEPAPACGETDGTDAAARCADPCGDELKEVEDATGKGELRSGGEVPGCAFGVDRPTNGGGSLPGTEVKLGAVLAVAGPGALGYAGNPGAARCPGTLGGSGPAGADPATAGPQGANTGVVCGGAATGPAKPDTAAACGTGCPGGGLQLKEVRRLDTAGSESAGAAGGDPGGAGWADERDRGGIAVGSQPQDILRMAGTGALGDGGGAAGSAGRSPSQPDRPAEGSTSGAVGGTGEGTGGAGQPAAHSGGDRANVGGTAQRGAAA
jgi:transposase InsO family protein